MTDLLKQIAGHLTVMMGSAQPHIEGEEVAGYTIKTGSLHKLIGLLAGAGHPVIVPAVRWTGAPCHGMGGAHRCGDHRCTKDYCAASGVPAVAPALSDDEAAQEFMRWNLPGNDAALEFHELDTNAQVRRAFVDGVRRGLVLAAARGVVVDDTALNDAQLAALRADVVKRAEAIPGGPFQMYEKGRYTGLMNAIDPRSPHCTRDPALAAEFHALLVAEVAAGVFVPHGSNTTQVAPQEPANLSDNAAGVDTSRGGQHG